MSVFLFIVFFRNRGKREEREYSVDVYVVGRVLVRKKLVRVII